MKTKKAASESSDGAAASTCSDGRATSADFSRWLKANRIEYDGLAIVAAQQGGDVVFTTQNFAEGDSLALIPKAAVLSVRNASCAPVLTQLLEVEHFTLASVLNLAVAYERSIGKVSRWHGYLSTLQPHEPLPMLWSKADLTRLLAHTGLDTAACRRRRELLSEHRALASTLRGWGGKAEKVADAVSPLAYLYAATLTSSRAFYVDTWHEEALVPLADVLNHKAALVPEGAHVEGEDDEESDEEGGEEGGEEDGEEGNGEEGNGDEGNGEDSDADDEQPPIVDARVVSARRRAAAQMAARALDVSLAMDTTLHNLSSTRDAVDEEGDEGDEPNGHVALVALRPLPANVEVFNTYGEHSNRVLLNDYGFTLACNALDAAELPWCVVRTAAAAAIPGGERSIRARERSLRAHPACGSLYAELIGDDPSGAPASFGFNFDGTPPHELVLALSWLLAAPNPTPGWMAPIQPWASAAEIVELRHEAIEAARGFMAVDVASHLRQPLPTLAMMVSLHDVLSAAIRKHKATGYTHAALVAAGQGGDTPTSGSEDERSVFVGHLVRGELRIWQRAEAWLAECTATSSSKRKKRHRQ